MTSLVGYTGFVGSNIYKYGRIDLAYNSRNIKEAYGTNPDILIYAGLRAEKYLANSNPEADMELVIRAKENISKIEPQKLVLISTVDVLKEPNGSYENAVVDTRELQAYGYNRYVLEQWVREHYPDALIIRLPGLFGINIKKNFIYDYLNVIPFMLKKEKFVELSLREPDLHKYYFREENGFYKCNQLDDSTNAILKNIFRELGFTALYFTDSRNVYQFYPLSRLADDIQTALKHGLIMWHPATEPVSAAEIYQYLTGEVFDNQISAVPVYYDYRTKYAELFGGRDGYLLNKQQVLEEIRRFVSDYK